MINHAVTDCSENQENLPNRITVGSSGTQQISHSFHFHALHERRRKPCIRPLGTRLSTEKTYYLSHHIKKLTSQLPWRVRQFLGVVRFINWVLKRNIYVWALTWGKLNLNERNETCRHTELTWVGEKHLAVFSIPENCRLTSQNVSIGISLHYLADVEQCFNP
jgi:hypothetical protein